MALTSAAFAAALDSTNLRLDASDADLRLLCEQAAHHRFACVMLYPASVALASSLLKGSGVGVGTVIGFPSGRFSTASKSAEIVSAVKAGATEVDVVMNYSALREGRDAEVAAELVELTRVAHGQGALIKVITENCFLPLPSIERALVLCEDAGVDFIKTSTGFGSSGATVEHIRLWAARRRGGIRIKAAGGIKSLADALALLEAGAVRLGTSGAASLMDAFAGSAKASPLSGY